MSESTELAKATEAGAANDPGAAAEGPKPLPFFQLFRFCSIRDKWFIFTGCFAGFLNGALVPLFAIVLGQMITSLNEIDESSAGSGDLTEELTGAWITIRSDTLESGQLENHCGFPLDRKHV